MARAGRSSAIAITDEIVGVPTELMDMGKLGASAILNSEVMVVKLKGVENVR